MERRITLRFVETEKLHAKETLLWVGAGVTAGAAVFFPRVQGIRDTGDSWWRLAVFFVPEDREGVVLVTAGHPADDRALLVCRPLGLG